MIEAANLKIDLASAEIKVAHINLTVRELTANEMINFQAQIEPYRNQKLWGTVNALSIIYCCDELQNDCEETLRNIEQWPHKALQDAANKVLEINNMNVSEDEEKK